MEKNCPCVDCICIPVCRERRYSQMIRICIDFQDYLYEESDNKIGRKPRGDFSDRIKIANDTLKHINPVTRWHQYKYKEILVSNPKYYRHVHKTVFKKEDNDEDEKM